MGQRVSGSTASKLVARAALVGALAGLGGCAGDASSAMGNLFSLGGSSGAAPAASAVPVAAGAPDPTKVVCPYVDVKEGGAAHRVYAGGQSSANVRYQFSLGDIARECRVVGNQLVLKVGVEGKVLLGPAGSPSSFTVPVTVSVRRDGEEKMLASRTYNVPASVPQGASNSTFSVISEDIAVPFVSEAANEDYEVFVGLNGAQAEPRRDRRKR
ncbi:MAG: hypothetical protein JWN93_2705 [Hyphomicrobiales bacterium]|nr:hypothetical protein [Hyphomicrobiales bacterium]